jgi:hypothetical protein
MKFLGKKMTEEELYEKIPKWIESDKKSWNIVTFFAYFLRKYENKNGVKFRITKSRNGPLSSKEMRDFSRLFEKLAPEDYSSLPKEERESIKELTNIKLFNYINWMFDYKFRMPGTSPDGTQIFFSPSYLNHFERMYADAMKKKSKKSTFEDFLAEISKIEPKFLDNNECTSEQDLMMIQSIWIQKGKPDNSLGRAINLAINIGILNDR